MKDKRKFIKVKVIGENLEEDNLFTPLDEVETVEETEEEIGSSSKVILVVKNAIDEEEFKALFDNELYLTDLNENENITYTFETDEEIELTPALKEKLLKYAKSNTARIIINDEVIYDFLTKYKVQKTEKSIEIGYDIYVITKKIPYKKQYKEWAVMVDETGNVSYEGKLSPRLDLSGVMILPDNFPYVYYTQQDRAYFIFPNKPNDFENKKQFVEFVNKAMANNWKSAKILLKKQILLGEGIKAYLVKVQVDDKIIKVFNLPAEYVYCLKGA